MILVFIVVSKFLHEVFNSLVVCQLATTEAEKKENAPTSAISKVSTFDWTDTLSPIIMEVENC